MCGCFVENKMNEWRNGSKDLGWVSVVTEVIDSGLHKSDSIEDDWGTDLIQRW